MITAYSSNGTRPDPYTLADYQYSKLNQASVDVQASAGISLVTADGDRVTLHASSSLQASLQTYDYLGRSQGQTVAARGEKFQLSASSGVAVSVQGSLDEEELADIQDLLDTLSKVSNDFSPVTAKWPCNIWPSSMILARLPASRPVSTIAGRLARSRQAKYHAVPRHRRKKRLTLAPLPRQMAGKRPVPSLTNCAGSLCSWTLTTVSQKSPNDSFNYSKNSPTNWRWAPMKGSLPIGYDPNTRGTIATATDKHNKLIERLQARLAQAQSGSCCLATPASLGCQVL